MSLLKVVFLLVIITASSGEDDLPDIPACDSPIYCTGPILEAVQLLKIYHDSKEFVDMPLGVPPEVALDEFAKLGIWPNITKEQVEEFLKNHFLPADSELLSYKPPDWKPVAEGGLPLSKNITDETLRTFAGEIHNKWQNLGKKMSDAVAAEPEKHSLVAVPNPFVVPGGRFREMYYWDSFWVIQGLLTSGMVDTAKGMIQNFAHLINKFGHMPNANRVYFERRSQPPFLALMLDNFRRHINVPLNESNALLAEILPALEKEYDFWMTKRQVIVTKDNVQHVLNVYRGGITHPRPESFREDQETATHNTAKSNKTLYANIAAGAESGWDFSTRWLPTPQSHFSNIRTESIIPVDLNAFLCAQENLMGQFYRLLEDAANGEKYEMLAQKRAEAIQQVLWNSTKGMWRDYDHELGVQREDFYLSNVAPVFAKCSSPTTNVTGTEFLRTLVKSEDLRKLVGYPGGFPASFLESSGGCCQWDFPNAWPPLQLILIEGFAGNSELRPTALEWAQKWVNAVHTGFKNSTFMYEKYDSRTAGSYGSGGEYKVQEGFGWTNGGILRLLELFPTELTSAGNYLHQGVAASLFIAFLVAMISYSRLF